MHTYIRAVNLMSRAAGVLAALLLAAGVAVVSQMVFVRYALNGSTIWQTEFVLYAVTAATFMGTPYVLLERGHVNVDLLPGLLPPRARLAVNILAGLLGLAFVALMAWSGWIYFEEALSRGWRTETVWAIPLWIPLLPLPLGLGLTCLQYVAELWRKVQDGKAAP